MNDIIRTLQFEKEQLEARIRLLEDKLESDNRQISEYDHELRQAKRLVKAMVEDRNAIGLCETCKYYPENNSDMCQEDDCYKWRYADEARALIGGEYDD